MQDCCLHWETFVFMMMVMSRVIVPIVIMAVMIMTMPVKIISMYSIVTLCNFLWFCRVVVSAFFTVFMNMFIFYFIVMLMIVFLGMIMFVLSLVVMWTVFVIMLLFLFSIIHGRFSFNFSTFYNNFNLMFVYLLSVPLFFMAVLLVLLINQALNVFAN